VLLPPSWFGTRTIQLGDSGHRTDADSAAGSQDDATSQPLTRSFAPMSAQNAHSTHGTSLHNAFDDYVDRHKSMREAMTINGMTSRKNCCFMLSLVTNESPRPGRVCRKQPFNRPHSGPPSTHQQRCPPSRSRNNYSGPDCARNAYRMRSLSLTYSPISIAVG
jgi:hypothetical protein